MIRVLHVLGGLAFGGAESMVMNIYRRIDKSKIQFDFIIHTEAHQDYYDEVIQLGGRIYSFPKFNGKNIVKIKKLWRRFFKLHPEYKILHSHIRSYSSIYLPIAKKNGVKTIVHSHSTSNGKGFTAFVKKILQFPIRWRSDYFMACSRESGEWLFGKKVVKTNRFFILKNSVDLNKYRYSESIRKIYREKMNLSNKTVFIHIGRLHEAKNHEFLIGLFSLINRNNDDSRLLIVGDGPLKEKIQHLINDLHLEKNIKMLGSRNDISELLSASDCFLFPSKWEGLPVSVIEAQASGIPCLISDTITKEVGVSCLVKYLPINTGYQEWISAINNTNFARKNVEKEIIESGFDIESTIDWLKNFYGGIISE